MLNMLEHQMVVLENVSDNVLVFKKELDKSTKWLNDEELLELKKWLISKYQHRYNHVINEMLGEVLLSKAG